MIDSIIAWKQTYSNVIGTLRKYYRLIILNLAAPITLHQYMSKCQKLGISTNYRSSKMHCVEYCYRLITIIIISVLIVVIIIYHHYYHHCYDYYYLYHHFYHQNRYPHLKYRYLKYYLEYNSGNKLVSIRTSRKLFTNLTQKVMSTSKN